jgi:hypothetical protein
MPYCFPNPSIAVARIDTVLAGHEPHPALAVDRHGSLVAANMALGRLLVYNAWFKRVKIGCVICTTYV